MTQPRDPKQILADAVRRQEAAREASREAAREAVERLESDREGNAPS